MARTTTRGNTPRQEPWSTEDIVEVVHTAIADLMGADLEKQGLDPTYATNPEAAVMFNIVHHHVNQDADGDTLVEQLRRERNRDDLVSGLDELNQYITDHATDFLVWGQLPDHSASPVIEVVPNPFYLDRLAYLCLAVATEFADRGRNTLATLRKFNLEVDGTRGDLDSAWLESSLAWEHLTSAVNAIEQIMAHELAGTKKVEDTIAPKLHLIAESSIRANPDIRFPCPHCDRMTKRRSPFCDHCGLQAREIIPAWDEPLDGVGDSAHIHVNLDDGIVTVGELLLFFDSTANTLVRIDRPAGNDPSGAAMMETIAYEDSRFQKMLAWPIVQRGVGAWLDAHRIAPMLDEIIANLPADHNASPERMLRNDAVRDAAFGGEIVAECQVCNTAIYDTGHRDLTCPNGCDQLKGDRCTCPSCTNIVPAIFNHCPNCGYILINAEIFVD